MSAWLWTDEGADGEFLWDIVGSFEPADMARQFEYIGPCLTPTEHDDAVAQARAEALREAAGVLDGWLSRWGKRNITHITAQDWANSGMEDCRDNILSLIAASEKADV
ncbi:hypothetical protein MHZ93_04040 [Roseomonas sp. ACRSG]|nr:hypothetical protein [Roseomonas sp. ACRSG]